MVVIEVVVKGRKCFGLWWCWAITAAFPRQLYMPSPWAPYPHGCVAAGMEHFLETAVACEKGYHSRSLLPKSAALVAVDRGDHALANRLATAVGSIVDKCWVKFWIAYGISK
ncbi:hypothetical protein PENARI_c089G05507 [Penicillium arizonense]|uniref:Uncharacterized protein n=1 Tax=Penicillium arizonense TaxID=1835702 RepID=A0A1F5L1Q3_PENAI|nr:hypothetical protein PENARI_c089G05507 [Penicillium arizonense]OGE46920.1 hypothetical protein PENARI_c089G05507 [Penicillium arizonense]